MEPHLCLDSAWTVCPRFSIHEDQKIKKMTHDNDSTAPQLLSQLGGQGCSGLFCGLGFVALESNSTCESRLLWVKRDEAMV